MKGLDRCSNETERTVPIVSLKGDLMSKRNRRNRRRNTRSARAAVPDIPHREPQIFGERGATPGHMARILSAADGYANPTAFLGENSDLIASGTFHRSMLTADPELLTTAYREFWLATRIIDMPSEDMTRAWYTLTGNIPEEDMEDLKRLEARHSVKREITDAIRWARLYGGALAVIVIRGDEERLDQPLDPDLIIPDSFQGLLVLDRAQGISPSPELVTDLDDPDFGLPMYYTAEIHTEEARSVKIHHSRVLRFVSRELPRMEQIAENYWGASELEHMWDDLMKRSAVSANICQLVFQANVTTLKMADFGESMALGTDHQKQAIVQMIAEENRIRSSYGLQLLSRDDSMENHSYTFSGLPDVYECFMMDVCGAAEIPATKLFGRSPQGFQSTGESDLRNYYEMIAGLQERMLRPALEKLLPVMVISCWGYLPEDLDFVFNPLSTESPDHVAELAEKLSAPVIEAYKAGLITREEALAELKARGEPYAVWTKI